MIGRSNTKGRVVKFMIKSKELPANFVTSTQKWTKKKKEQDVFERIINEICNDEKKLKLLQDELKSPFISAIKNINKTLSQVLSIEDNSPINKIAQLAFLLVEPKATEMWEITMSKSSAIDRPAVVEQTDGTNNVVLSAYEKLLAIGNAMKHEWDNSCLFTSEHIGEEAAEAISAVRPSEATFKNVQELKQQRTAIVNKHDELLSRLDRSGVYNVIGSYERRIECWNNFCGPKGKAKNIGLFIAFIVWEGKEYKWLNNSIKHTNPTTPETPRTAGMKKEFSKKEMKEIKKMRIMGQAFSMGSQLTSSSDTSGVKNRRWKDMKDDEEYKMSKRKLMESKVALDNKLTQAKTEMESLTMKQNHASSLALVLKDEQLVSLMSSEELAAMKAKWFRLVMSNNEQED